MDDRGRVRWILTPGALGLCAWALGGVAGALQSPGQPTAKVETRIQASYSEEGRRLDGTVTQVWTNPTADSVPDLWFHLYWNAFSNNQSTLLQESKGKLRDHALESGSPGQSEWGWQRVTSVLVEGEERVGTLRFRQPNGGSPADRTVFSIELARPLAPGATVDVTIRWESQMPRLRRRTGYKDDFLMVAHWFPKLGVYEGGSGWNCHEFHEHTEFFGNFGTYDVELELPVRYEGHVFASGVSPSPPTRRGERVITRFQAPSAKERTRLDAAGRTPMVHDFAWTADPDVKARRDTFHFDEWRQRYPDEVARAQLALGPDRKLDLPEVEISVLMQPEREGLWRRHFEAASGALFFYGLWFGEYPFERLTLVDPPWGGGQAGGMEYPTLITCGASLFVAQAQQGLEGVTVHEAGHQFLYGVVANNEFEEAWLDEGINSWADAEVLIRSYGPRVETTAYSGLHYEGVTPFPVAGGSGFANLISGRALDLPWTDFRLRPLRSSGFVDFWRDMPFLTFVESAVDQRWADRIAYLRAPATDPLGVSWSYQSRETYRVGSYMKPAVALRSVPGVLGENGDERLLRGLRRYADAMRFRHARSADFEREFSAGADADLGWYFDDLFRGTGTIDWSIEVSEREFPQPMGFFQPESAAPFAHRAKTQADDVQQELEVLVRRAGELCLPVDVRWTFDDGSSETVRWTREEQQLSRWKRFKRVGAKKCVSAAIDPERAYYLDRNLSDNQWFLKKDVVAPWRWAERAFSRASQWLHFQGGLGG